MLWVSAALAAAQSPKADRAAIAGQPPASQPRQDVLLLKNGDRLQGEIKGLSRGRLSFDIKAVGIISVKWDHVAELSSDSLFEVEINDGQQLLGTLPPAAPGELTVSTPVGKASFDIMAVVGIAPIRKTFLQRLDGSISVGGSYTQASGVAQVSFAFNVKARRPGFEWRARAEDYVTFESDGATSERLSASLGYSRDLTGRWAIFAGGQVERNPDLGFDLRTTVGGGIERTLMRTNRTTLAVGAGLGASREVPVDGSSESLVPGLLILRHSFFTYSTPKTSLDTSATVYPILNQSGRWRIEASTSLSREIFKDFTVGLTFYESFDNRPPSAEAKKNDVGATLSVGFTF